ncbi:hypothetical protein Efla_002985 [Eimeria flavescens]
MDTRESAFQRTRSLSAAGPAGSMHAAEGGDRKRDMQPLSLPHQPEKQSGAEQLSMQQPAGEAAERLEMFLHRLEETTCQRCVSQQAQRTLEDLSVEALLERGAWCLLETELLQQQLKALAASMDAESKTSGTDW